MNIELDNINRWPKDFKKIALEKLPLFYNYFCQQSHVDLGESEYNEFRHDYNVITKAMEKRLIKNRLVVYHCTRLTAQEIKLIKNNGLFKLSANLIQQRISNAQKNSYISHDEAQLLLESKEVQNTISGNRGNRKGFAWFCSDKHTLQDTHAVERLFRSWGGEALYINYEHHDIMGEILRNIGLPCIVKCSIPFVDIKTFAKSFTEKFLLYLISTENEEFKYRFSMDLYLERNTSPNEVVEIIEYSTQSFNELTSYRE